MTGQSTPIGTCSKVYLYICLVRAEVNPADITSTYDELRQDAGAALCKVNTCRADAGTTETGANEEGCERIFI